jgi:hypothetical protein
LQAESRLQSSVPSQSFPKISMDSETRRDHDRDDDDDDDGRGIALGTGL